MTCVHFLISPNSILVSLNPPSMGSPQLRDVWAWEALSWGVYQHGEPSVEGCISKQHTPLTTVGLGCVPGAQSTTDTFLSGEGEVACARRNMVAVTPWGLNSSFHMYRRQCGEEGKPCSFENYLNEVWVSQYSAIAFLFQEWAFLAPCHWVYFLYWHLPPTLEQWWGHTFLQEALPHHAVGEKTWVGILEHLPRFLCHLTCWAMTINMLSLPVLCMACCKHMGRMGLMSPVNQGTSVG